MPDTLVGGAVAVEADGHEVLPQGLGGERGADRDGHGAAHDAGRAEHAHVHRGDVHGTALALVVAVCAAHQLGHHAARVAALGDGVAVTAMGAGDVVAGSQRGAGADRDGLGTDVGVRQAVDEVLLPELLDDRVELADEAHAPIHLAQLLASSAGGASSGARTSRSKASTASQFSVGRDAMSHAWPPWSSPVGRSGLQLDGLARLPGARPAATSRRLPCVPP